MDKETKKVVDKSKEHLKTFSEAIGMFFEMVTSTLFYYIFLLGMYFMVGAYIFYKWIERLIVNQMNKNKK